MDIGSQIRIRQTSQICTVDAIGPVYIRVHYLWPFNQRSPKKNDFYTTTEHKMVKAKDILSILN